MKTSGWVVAVLLAAGGLALQGCASTGAAQSSDGAGVEWSATGPDSAIIQRPGANQPVIKADTKENFEAIVAAIQKQMQSGGRWQYVNAKEKSTIDSTFSDMGKLYDQFGSVEKMDPASKLRLYADQSTVNALLTKKDGERIICQSRTPVGSHLPIKTCTTYAQIQAEQNQAERFLHERNAASGQVTAQDKSPTGGH